MNNLKSGAGNIKKHLSNIPKKPGIYKMISEKNIVLYVGKAKNLLNRVTNYTRPERLEYRIQRMISQVVTVEIIITQNEAKALILEANLIKKYQPKYNILLKDGKTYPYILIKKDHAYPQIVKHRGQRKAKGDYYGPFASAGAVNKVVLDLQRAFLLRPCTDSFMSKRERPCLEYQIKRCSAPCVDKVSKQDYGELVTGANNFMKGKTREVQKALKERMDKSSEEMNYENAAIYRDRIKALNQIQTMNKFNITGIENADIIGLSYEANKACIQVYFFRNWQHYGNNSFFPSNVDDQSEEEILYAFILQFYNERNISPSQIIISHEIVQKNVLQEYLSEISQVKVQIICPKLGDKKKAIDDVVRNAKNSLKQKILQKSKQKDLLLSLVEPFNLSKPPKRIEVYDNSHTFGQDQVGGMIVATEDGFNKKAYRQFNIKDKSIEKGDDYAMMTEVLTRRLKRLITENPEYQEHIWPDLILIDGGLGHLGVVEKVFEKLDLTHKIRFVCISKGVERNAGNEQFHMSSRGTFTLPRKSKSMYYLQIIRDEAHRFAIGSHRNKRGKSVTKSELDSICGIGAKRKRILLNHFGSVADIKSATIEELMMAETISKKIAEVIYNNFH